MTELKRLFDAARDASEKRGIILGILGRVNGDGSTTVTVPNRPKFVYVRIGPPNGQTTTVAKNTANVPARANLPVRMKKEGNQLVIVDINTAQSEATTPDDTNNVFGTTKHTHMIGTGLEYTVEAMRLEPGLLRPAGGFNVSVNGFRYAHYDVWKTFLGDTINLAIAHQPLTSGYWRWVLVGVDPATNTIVAVSGADQTYATPLTVDQLDLIDFALYIPVGAVKVRADAPHLVNQSLYFDARNWIGGLNSFALDNLSDVVITSPAVSAVLMWDSGDAQWEDTQLMFTHIQDWIEGVHEGFINLVAGDPGDIEWNYNDTLGTATPTIKTNAIINDKLGLMLQGTVKGRMAGAGTGTVEDLSGAHLAAILSGGALSVTDITDFTEGVQDTIGAFFVDSADFDVTYDDALNTITGLIKNDAVTNAKAANMAAATIKGRAVGAGTGDPTDLTAAQLNAIVGSADLVLTSTLQTNGHVGIGIAPDVTFMQIIAENTVDGVITVIRNLQSGAEFNMFATGATSFGITDWIDSGVIETNSLASGGLVFSAYTGDILFQTDARTNRGVINSIGLGLGTINPQGKLHAHDGNGGKLVGSKAISSGTAVNIIPDATGDVTKLLMMNYVIAGSGGVTQGAHVSIANGGSLTIYSNAGNTVSMTVNANGSVEVQRTGGTLTYIVFYDMTWI